MQNGIIFDIKRYAIHDGPGIRTTIFFKGCPMQCRWCHNPEGIGREPEIVFREERCRDCDDCLKVCAEGAIVKEDRSKVVEKEKCNLCGECLRVCGTGALEVIGNEMSVGEVMNDIERDVVFFDESGGGVTFSGGEPLFQLEFLRELLKQCEEKSIHTTVDTSGYCSFDALDGIQDWVDLFLYDLKVLDDHVHKEYTGVSNAPILENLKKLSSCGNAVVIRIPIIHGVNDSDAHIKDVVNFLSPLKNIQEITLLPYHKFGVSKYSLLNSPNMVIEDFPDPNNRVDEIKKKLEKYGFIVRVGG